MSAQCHKLCNMARIVPINRRRVALLELCFDNKQGNLLFVAGVGKQSRKLQEYYAFRVGSDHREPNGY